MKRRLSTFGILLAAMMAMPASPSLAAFSTSSPATLTDSNELLVRKGGGGKGGGKRGRSRSGGGRSFSKGRTGFKNSGASLNRGSKPPKSGWSKSSKGKNGPSLKYAPNGNANRDRSRSGKWGGSRNINRDGNRGIDRRSDYNRGYKRGYNKANNRWRRYDNRYRYRGGWARPGWRYARPWNYGWYGGSRPSWGWWGASAAAWGVTTLATAAIINSAVDSAVATKTEYIVVPNTDYELYYGSVQPTNDDAVTFLVKADDGDYQINADCKAGTIDGQSPGNASEAELLNAACQVAFGSA